MALGCPLLTQILFPKQRVKTVKNLRRQHADLFRKPVKDQNPSLRQYCFAMDYRASQTEVTGTKISC